MDTNELWLKMQGEFGKIHSRLDVMEEQTKEIPKMKEDIATLKEDMVEVKGEIVTIKGEMATMKSEMATMKSEMTTMKGEITTIKGEMKVMNLKIDNIAEKLDTTINVNLAQILNSQTLIRAELKKFISQDI